MKAQVQSACVTTPNPGRRPTTISGGVLNDKALELPKPDAVPDQRGKKARGWTSVQVEVGEDGNVIGAVGVIGDRRLYPAAVAAAQRARFKPVLLSGYPVKVSGVIFYKF